MKRIFWFFLLFWLGLSVQADSPFVNVENGQFLRNGKPYYFVGTNFWYAPILGSKGTGGDRKRLRKELDQLKALGINNLRILVGPDAGSKNANTVTPYLQPEAGVLNDTILKGLDYLLAEMEKRKMLGVLYLTNSWDWSGGFGFYLRAVGKGDSPSASGDGYNNYVRYASQFVKSKEAQELYYNFVRKIVSRENSVTGKLYKNDPTIMSWQLCNEPRPFSKEGKSAFAQWIAKSASLIKSIDSNHLVSTGSEGLYGCEVDINLCEQIHACDAIDYITVHIWPYNWQWAAKNTLWEDLAHVYVKSGEYIDEHARISKKIGKPFVIEEFGYPRERFSFSPQSYTTSRDAFYAYVMRKVVESSKTGGCLAGCNFWGWGGLGRPAQETWKPGNDYLCDPPHEPQGWYSVFNSDSTTIKVITDYIKELKNQ